MQNLKEYSIYELRTLARSIGVKSPTTKKHSELVEEILKICNKEIEPTHTNKGRHAKICNIDCNNILQKNEIIEQYKNKIKIYLEEIEKSLDKIKKILK